jgi:ABC-2 type transport system ATP-binding protein
MESKNKETYWSRFVDEYEEKQQAVVGKELILLVKNEILTEKETGNVLELGCGTGLYSEILAKKAAQVLATDFSQEMVEAAIRKRGNLENTKFQQANALEIQFEDSVFDMVFMANLIHVVGNPERVIQESKRVLKKGGRILITSFAINDMSLISRIAIAIRYIRTFGKPSPEAVKEKVTKRSIELLLKKNDFQIAKSLLLGTKNRSFYIVGIKK